MGALTVTSVAYSQSVICDYQRGWTKHVIGGLGGEIIKVTNLNTEGKGSLKAALNSEGARVVVFEVAGKIDLKGKMLKVTNPFLTIAGQTSPSPGITLINGGIKIKTHDVVIQHLHVRPGALGHKKGWEPDGISVQASHNIIIDPGKTKNDWQHNTSHNVTFSNNIIAEALEEATHLKGAHSKGTLIHDNVQNVLIYQNLYSSNRWRNPHFKGGASGAIINNVISNPGNAIFSYAQLAREWKDKPFSMGKLYIVDNHVFKGLDTHEEIRFLIVRGELQAYVADNYVFNLKMEKEELAQDKFEKLDKKEMPSAIKGLASGNESLSSFWENVGARPWDRDKVDLRIIKQSKNGSSRIIDYEPKKQHSMAKPIARSKFKPQDWDACFVKRH